MLLATPFILVLFLALEAFIDDHIILYGSELYFEQLPIYFMGIHQKLSAEPLFLSITTKFEYCMYFRELVSQVCKYTITSLTVLNGFISWLFQKEKNREIIWCSSFTTCCYAFFITLLSLHYISHSNFITIIYVTVGNAIDVFLSTD